MQRCILHLVNLPLIDIWLFPISSNINILTLNIIACIHLHNYMIQFSSVTQSCLTLCEPMDCSTLGFPVHHQILELAQTHILRWWCHQTISSSVIPFSSCLWSFPESGCFPMSQFFTSGGQSIGASASVSILRMNIQGWFPLGWTGLISLLSKGFSRVFSSTTIWRHKFFGAQPSSWSNSQKTVLTFRSKRGQDFSLPRSLGASRAFQDSSLRGSSWGMSGDFWSPWKPLKPPHLLLPQWGRLPHLPTPFLQRWGGPWVHLLL